MMILTAPSGVTKIAGANAYAAKLAISPTITAEKSFKSEIFKDRLSRNKHQVL